MDLFILKGGFWLSGRLPKWNSLNEQESEQKPVLQDNE